MLHSISKSLPVQSSVSFGIIIRAKIGYLFLPHLLQQVQASPLYCHLFQHSLRLKISQDEMIKGDFIPYDAFRETCIEKVEKLIFKVPTC